jgi:hypothetical protein
MVKIGVQEDAHREQRQANHATQDNTDPIQVAAKVMHQAYAQHAGKNQRKNPINLKIPQYTLTLCHLLPRGQL